MKKLFFFVFISAGITSFAQENFIEVVVTDTMMLQPKSWTYTTTVHPDLAETVGVTDVRYGTKNGKLPSVINDFSQSKKKSPPRDLTTLASRHGGLLNSDEGAGLTLQRQSNFEGRATSFVFTNLDSLKHFVKELEGLENVEGRLTKIYPIEAEPAMTQLDSRIVAIAKKRAENLASVSGRRLGLVLHIIEDSSSAANPYQNFMESIFKFDLMGKGDGTWALLNNQITVTRILKVRFALL